MSAGAEVSYEACLGKDPFPNSSWWSAAFIPWRALDWGIVFLRAVAHSFLLCGFLDGLLLHQVSNRKGGPMVFWNIPLLLYTRSKSQSCPHSEGNDHTRTWHQKPWRDLTLRVCLGNLDGREVWGRMDSCIYMYGWPLCYLPEIVTTSFVNWLGFPGGLDGKKSACNAGDLGLIPG